LTRIAPDSVTVSGTNRVVSNALIAVLSYTILLAKTTEKPESRTYKAGSPELGAGSQEHRAKSRERGVPSPELGARSKNGTSGFEAPSKCQQHAAVFFQFGQ
jgi:hypothetical protein